jgi:hypothetical protein
LTLLYGYITILLHDYMTTWLYYYMTMLLHDYMTTWLHTYMSIWLHNCIVENPMGKLWFKHCTLSSILHWTYITALFFSQYTSRVSLLYFHGLKPFNVIASVITRFVSRNCVLNIHMHFMYVFCYMSKVYILQYIK